MASLYEEFHQGLKQKQWTEQQIKDVWALLSKQAEYSFNRGHAVAYSLLSYLTAYLKIHYSTEFMTALLTAKSDRTEKLSAIINDCTRMGIKVLPPQINESKLTFTAKSKENEILFGFGAVKGIGESVIAKILESQPYSSFDNYLEKIQDKTATIALIKAGAFPSTDKMKLMQRYAKSLFSAKEYKPVTSLPTKAKLLVDWNINVEDYKVGKKTDKETVLALYNQKRKEQHDKEQKCKCQSFMAEFHAQYAQNEFLWEFQSLSMFITENPLQEAYNIIGTEWDDVPDGNKAVVPCVIVDIKRKKDKNNNQFAYIDLCTNNQIIEGTIWSKQLKEYYELIEKGSCVCILGRKSENHLFVEKVKSYNQWLADVQKKKNRGRH
jgi:DNA polymerase-3 subunit alpha